MSFETILNLTWLLLGVLLVLALGIPQSHCSRSRRVATLFLAALFAFPCISASDDLWSFRGLPESQKTLQSGVAEDSQRSMWRLAHFFEGLQTLTLPRPLALSALFFFLGLASSDSEPAGRWTLLYRAGRSPPSVRSLAHR